MRGGESKGGRKKKDKRKDRRKEDNTYTEVESRKRKKE